MISDAKFSPDRKYRYVLRRIWSEDYHLPLLGIVGKNPSVANEKDNDPTIYKEIALGHRLLCRGLVKVNMFSMVATDADELIKIGDGEAVGKEGTVEYLIKYLENCSPVICAWGTHTNRRLADRIHQRGDMLTRRLLEAGFDLKCLKINKDGTPAHPLYLPALELQAWPRPTLDL